jgi:phage terminase Nu1 subunit (DNA packaging protein)
MTVTTKASLAAELGISKARVSQYAKRGLPVLPSGKLDREIALYWIKSHIYYTASSDGSTRARQLIREGFAYRPSPKPQRHTIQDEPGVKLRRSHP